MSAQLPPASGVPIARRAREQFVGQIEGVLAPMAAAIFSRLVELIDQATSTRDMHERNDAMRDFDRLSKGWADGTVEAWRSALVPPTATARVRMDAATFELIGDDVVENKILSSRLAQAVMDKASWEFSDLRLRLQDLEGGDDLANHDILRAAKFLLNWNNVYM